MSTLNTASNYIEKIDSLYPLPGKTNDSQGFRNNFKNIKLALEYTDEDTYNLKLNSVRLDNPINDFNDNIIKRAAFQDTSFVVYDGTNVLQRGDVVVDYQNGSFQKFVIDGGLHTFSVTNWPEGDRSGHVIIAVTATTTTSLISFNSQYVYNLGQFPLPIGLVTREPYVFELWNGGDENSLYVRQIVPESLYESIYDLVRPINLKNYTESQLLSLTNVKDGALVFLKDNYNTPAYYNEGFWYAINAVPLPIYLQQRATYSIRTLISDSSYYEGTSVTFLVQTTNVADGTKLYWTTFLGNGITSDDFLDNQLSGVITINSGGATITRTFRLDNVTDGDDNFKIEIRTDGITGAIVTTSNTIGILDAINPTTILTQETIFPTLAYAPYEAPPPYTPTPIPPSYETWPASPPTYYAPSPVAPSPIAPSPVAPSPVAPSPVAPSPVAPSPVAPSPVAPSPVAPSPAVCGVPPTPRLITGILSPGTVYGSGYDPIKGYGPYTYDSRLGMAAVHAGLLSPGETGRIDAGYGGFVSNFIGTTQNGITSNSYSNACGLYIKTFTDTITETFSLIMSEDVITYVIGDVTATAYANYSANYYLKGEYAGETVSTIEWKIVDNATDDIVYSSTASPNLNQTFSMPLTFSNWSNPPEGIYYFEAILTGQNGTTLLSNRALFTIQIAGS